MRDIFEENKLQSSEELLRKIDAFATKPAAAGGGDPADNKAVFSLYSGSGPGSLRAQDLQQRIAKLEEVIGEPLSSTTDAMSQLAYIADRLDVVGDPGKLQQISTQ